jgi:aldehyde dehydrogenase (NAD+)
MALFLIQYGAERNFRMASVLSAPVESPVSVPPTKLLINNRWVESKSGKSFATVNPATGDEICQVSEADAADVDIAVKAARDAFEAKAPWRRMSAAERGRLLYRLADLIEKHADHIAKLEALDNGKPYAVAKAADVPKAIACYRYFAGWADKVQGRTIPVAGDYFSYTRHEPVGMWVRLSPGTFRC